MLKSVDEDGGALATLVPGLVVQDATQAQFVFTPGSPSLGGKSPGHRHTSSSGAVVAERDWSRLSAKSIPRMRKSSTSLARSEFTVSSEDDDDCDFSIDGEPDPSSSIGGARFASFQSQYDRHQSNSTMMPTSGGSHFGSNRRQQTAAATPPHAVDSDDDDDCDFYLLTPQPPKTAQDDAPSLPRFARPTPAAAAADGPASRPRGATSGNCTPPGSTGSPAPRRPPSTSTTLPPAAAPPPYPPPLHHHGRRRGSSGASLASLTTVTVAPRGEASASVALPPPPQFDLSTELDDENPATVGASTLPHVAGAGADADVGLPPLGPSLVPRGSGAAAAAAARQVGGHRSVDSAATAVHSVGGGGRGTDSRSSSVSDAAPLAKTRVPAMPPSKQPIAPPPARRLHLAQKA